MLSRIKPKFCVIVVMVAVSSFILGITANKTLHAADNIYASTKLLMGVLSLVNNEYVDQIEPEKLIYGAIDGMLEVLDPHSNFLSKESFAEMGERFSGKFYGIGIEFDILDGFLHVISVIENSPSETVGLQSGDRIVKIDGESAIGIKHDEVRKKLRGEKGTKVNVTVERTGVNDHLNLTIIRDRIPIRSVRSAIILEDNTGYIQMIRFAKTTSRELESALAKLQLEGMEQLILDLRGNSGGYLDQAVEVSSKFIPEGQIIVETMGRHAHSKKTFRSISGIDHLKMPLVIMLDHRSASASEIVAGAVQDWDRGVIAGTRSFGKGLVQTVFAEPYLKDGSALKLTTARYYTPSGRMIQRDYKNQSFKEYIEGSYSNPEEETLNGKDREVFTTANGRKVFGDGGITPDIILKLPKRNYPFVIGNYRGWVPFDRACFEFATAYGATRPDLKDDFDFFLKEFQVDKTMLETFKTQVRKSGIDFMEKDFDADLDVIELQLKRSLARNLWGDDEASRIAASGDTQIQQVLDLFQTHTMLMPK